jgi:hypothetical protein
LAGRRDATRALAAVAGEHECMACHDGGCGGGLAAHAHPLTFFLMALMTSFTPRLICFRLAAFLASLST